MADPSMIERVALAISIEDECGLAIRGRRALCDDPEAQEPSPAPCRCRSVARAAIEAMREPTPAMIAAGDWNPWEGTSESFAEIGWKYMIDAALTPPQPKNERL